MTPLVHRSSGIFVTLLLVGALFLCHGAFGAVHLYPDPEVAAGHVEEHPASTLHGGATHEAEHPVGVGYYAVLLVALLGTLLVLLSAGAPARTEVSAPRLFGRRFPPILLYKPRGPTSPLLQVFRL